MTAASFTDLLGRTATRPISRIGGPGAFLALDPTDPQTETVLLPGRELGPHAAAGDLVTAFFYRDSEGRPIATTTPPRLQRGEVAFLRVVQRTDFGAFVEWGPPKELLVPLAEQTTEMRVGERYAVGLDLDRTGRLIGTMRVAELLGRGTFTPGAWVEGEAWREVPGVGLFVILAKTSLGLVPKDEPHTLARGEAARFRVSHVHPDGKVELSLRGHAHEELAGDAARVLAVLAAPGAAPVSERASPAELRARFGLSKKAFKRAVGHLFRERRVVIDAEGHVRPTVR